MAADEPDVEMIPEDAGESVLDVEPIPGYLVLKDAFKEEGRRAYILSYVMTDSGVLLDKWEEEAAKLEEFLKTGAAKPRTNMKVVK